MNFRIACFVVIAAFSVRAHAHHSFAMFDQEEMITISGTLKEFEWKNPHCWLHVVVVDPVSGREVEWLFEMGSISQIAEQGWAQDSVEPGDPITVMAHPLKDGSRGGQYQIARLSGDRTLRHPDAQEP